jgi:hypothetical protein
MEEFDSLEKAGPDGGTRSSTSSAEPNRPGEPSRDRRTGEEGRAGRRRKASVKRNRLIEPSGGTHTVNRELGGHRRAPAGIMGYVPNLPPAPDGTPGTVGLVIGACQHLLEIERSFRMARSDPQARPVCSQ